MRGRQSPEQRRLIRVAAAMNAKARRLGRPGRIDWTDLHRLEAGGRPCFYCGIFLEEGHGTFDHAQALDAGGPNNPMNVVRCCTTCNRRKFTKTPAEYAAHQELEVACVVCGKVYKPRWAEYQNGRARTCSHACAARKRWA